MGRDIVRRESHDAGERSRLWRDEDSFSVLNYETGTKKTEGLTLDMHVLNKSGNNGKKRRYEEFLDKSRLLSYATSVKRHCLNFLSGQSESITIISPKDVYLRADALKSMTNLRLLKLNYVTLTGNYKVFPKKLAWLCWHGLRLKNIPVEFTLENLVVLDLHHSRLRQVWKETPFLQSLKILDLSYSELLERTPNFFGLPKLERLILNGCVSLVEVCESIGDLEMLDLLDLQGCRTLKKLPKNIGKLVSLRTLIISGCNIGELPSEMRNMRSLEILDANGIFISSSESRIQEIKWWQPNYWSKMPKPSKGPQALLGSLPCSLKELRLSGSNISDDSFPNNFDIPSLYLLDLSKSQIRRMPSCFSSHSGLIILNVDGCHKLESLVLNDSLSITRRAIDARHCKLLENVALKGSNELWLNGCSKLAEIQDCLEPGMAMFEYGIFNIYSANGSIPRFSGEIYPGSSMHFIVPPHSTCRIQYLKVWCMSERAVVTEKVSVRLSIKIENKTKDLTWIYCPYRFGYDNNLQWLSRWRFGNQLEVGDEINITFHYEYDIKECGYKIVYHPNKEEDNGSTSNAEESHHDFPTLRLTTGEYFFGSCFSKQELFPVECSGHVHSRACYMN